MIQNNNAFVKEHISLAAVMAAEGLVRDSGPGIPMPPTLRMNQSLASSG